MINKNNLTKNNFFETKQSLIDELTEFKYFSETIKSANDPVEMFKEYLEDQDKILSIISSFEKKLQLKFSNRLKKSFGKISEDIFSELMVSSSI